MKIKALIFFLGLAVGWAGSSFTNSYFFPQTVVEVKQEVRKIKGNAGKVLLDQQTEGVIPADTLTRKERRRLRREARR